MVEQRWLTVKDVAVLLHIAENTVRKWETRGKLPKAVRFGPRKDRRFPKGTMMAFASSLGEGPKES